jgi:hypothetical protein
MYLVPNPSDWRYKSRERYGFAMHTCIASIQCSHEHQSHPNRREQDDDE